MPAVLSLAPRLVAIDRRGLALASVSASHNLTLVLLPPISILVLDAAGLDGVSLMVAPRAGRAGQQGNSVGTYICSDLTCSLVVRGKVQTGTQPETAARWAAVNGSRGRLRPAMPA